MDIYILTVVHPFGTNTLFFFFQTVLNLSTSASVLNLKKLFDLRFRQKQGIFVGVSQII